MTGASLSPDEHRHRRRPCFHARRGPGERADQRDVAQVPQGHAHDRGLPPGGGAGAALLLPPEAVVAGQLPHVPRGNGDAAAPRAGHDAGEGRARLREDRLVAATGDRLRQHGGRGHGHPHRGQAVRGMPPGRDGTSADQSSARLPDLRPGGRVPVAGVQRGARQRREPLPRGEGQEAEERGHRPAHPARRRALHHVLALHPLHRGDRGRSGAGLHRARQPHHAVRASGQAAGEQLLAQHRGHLPGRRADGE